MRLRNYQMDAVRSVLRGFKEHDSLLCCLPTGTGKTVILSHIVKLATKGRVLVIAHREELIEQLAATIRNLGLDVGIEMAERKATEQWWTPPQVVVATVQTLVANERRRLEELVPEPDLWSLTIVDEAHHAPAQTYLQILDHMRQNDSHRILGVTATPDRADETAMGAVFDHVAFEYGTDTAIADGWLVPVKQHAVVVDGLSYAKVRTTAGDLNGKDLAKVMEEEHTLHRMAVPTFELANGRPTVMFCVSVEQAERMAEIFNRMDPDCARSVSGKTPKDERRKLFRDYAEGKFQILTNCMVASEGWDAPHVQVVALARPTKSRALFAQMVGRGLRPLPGTVDPHPEAEDRKVSIATSSKPACDVLDYVGNAGRHTLICTTDILGGNYPDEVRDRARELVQAGEIEDPTEALEQAEEDLAAEQEKARLMEAARRAKLTAEAKYKTDLVDPFSVLGVSRPQASANPSTLKQCQLLQKFGVDASHLSAAEASKIQRTIFARKRAGLCSIKQAKVLQRYGYSPDTPQDEARHILDGLAKNGWKKRTA